MISRRVSLALVTAIPFLLAAEPPAVERSPAIQKAMADARKFLDLNMPSDAVAALEAEVANADGNKAYLSLLREAYLSELFRLEKAASPEPMKISQMRRNIALLGGSVPKPTAPPPAPPEPSLPAPTTDASADAAAAFKKGDYAAAEKLFASLPILTGDQKTASAYCRIKLAADRLNAPGCTPSAVTAILKDVNEAMMLVPQHAELQKVGQTLLATASAKQKESPIASSGDVVETASFIVRHTGNRELAVSLAEAAESQRKVIFERWSGPPAAGWSPKCEIVIHATVESYTKVTNRPAGCTGIANVRLNNGRATERRVDLRADDAAMVANALPRELTHVVLADLFPDRPPPKWASEGMAILAGSPEEVSRYLRTLPRCARDGDWFGLAQLMEMKDFPAEKITGFYCQSVSLTDHLIRAAGNERNFTIFLRDSQRYGTAQALKRQYGLDGPPALETAWKRAALETARGQAP
ncbi:MAG: hypothetical protein C0467_04455 [Planctomycetaceae bacterium]|nr:hypothetical protein [Planctomycetaceae bacterium]